MSSDLSNMCGVTADGFSPGKCVFIDGCHSADSSFVLHHFVSTYSKSGHNICFLGLSQSFNHYNSVGNKLGASLATARDNGNLVFIEGLKLLGEDIMRCETEADDQIVQTGNLVHYDSDNHNGLRNLYQHCKYCVKDLTTKFSDRPLLLVIDDISVLSLLGFSHLDIIHFMTYLRSLAASSNGCVIVQAQCDVSDDDDLEIVRQHIHHNSNYIFCVDGLHSGYCKDVHGQLTVYCRSEDPQEAPMSSTCMQYKIQDKNVVFFARGLSSAVL